MGAIFSLFKNKGDKEEFNQLDKEKVSVTQDSQNLNSSREADEDLVDVVQKETVEEDNNLGNKTNDNIVELSTANEEISSISQDSHSLMEAAENSDMVETVEDEDNDVFNLEDEENSPISENSSTSKDTDDLYGARTDEENCQTFEDEVKYVSRRVKNDDKSICCNPVLQTASDNLEVSTIEEERVIKMDEDDFEESISGTPVMPTTSDSLELSTIEKGDIINMDEDDFEFNQVSSLNNTEIATMVHSALMNGKSRGCTLEEICNYVTENYAIEDIDIKKSNPHLKRYITKEIKAGRVILISEGSTVKYKKSLKKQV